MPRFDAVAVVVVERVLGTCPKALRRRHKERVGLVLKREFIYDLRLRHQGMQRRQN